MASNIATVKNFIQVSTLIASSGQPTVDELSTIADAGYQTIVNLAVYTSDNAIPNEGDIVTGLGMSYVHIPVIWGNPTVDQFRLFAAVMDQQQRNKVWVHCALNMRVSAFLYLYRLLCRGEPEEQARAQLSQIWQPNAVWNQFIADVKAIYGR